MLGLILNMFTPELLPQYMEQAILLCITVLPVHKKVGTVHCTYGEEKSKSFQGCLLQPPKK